MEAGVSPGTFAHTLAVIHEAAVRSYRAEEGRGGACVVQLRLERQQGAQSLDAEGTRRCIGFQRCADRGLGPSTSGTGR